MTGNRQQSLLWGGIAAAAIVLLLIFGSMNNDRAQRAPERPPSTATPAPKKEPVERVKKWSEEPTVRLFINQSNEHKEVKLEEYLLGVVGGEIGPEAPLEAMKAQAILARTFTLDKLSQEEGSPCAKFDADVCTDPAVLQAYNPKNITEEVRQAVESTRGQVLLYEGDFVWGLYSAHAGGQAAVPEESFPGANRTAPYMKPVESPDAESDAPEEYNRWTLKISKAELASAVKASNADTVEILEKGPSERILKIKVGDKTVSGPELRLALGSEKLRSTRVTDLKVEGDQVTFTGTGWGHGSGLSQWGAGAMAKQGKNAEQILLHYFTGTYLQKLYDE